MKPAALAALALVATLASVAALAVPMIPVASATAPPIPARSRALRPKVSVRVSLFMATPRRLLAIFLHPTTPQVTARLGLADSDGGIADRVDVRQAAGGRGEGGQRR